VPEPDPDEEDRAADDRRQDEDEVETEDREHQQEREDPDRGPHQPLVEVEEDRVGVQPPALEVIEDDPDHEQNERNLPDPVEQGGKLVLLKPMSSVLIWFQGPSTRDPPSVQSLAVD